MVLPPHANTLKKLRTGKVRNGKKGQVMLVLTYKHVNEELKKLAEAEAERARRQRAVERKKKRIPEERKATREALDKQWRASLRRYQGVDIPAWQAERADVDKTWAAAKAAARDPSTPGRSLPTFWTKATSQTPKGGYL